MSRTRTRSGCAWLAFACTLVFVGLLILLYGLYSLAYAAWISDLPGTTPRYANSVLRFALIVVAVGVGTLAGGVVLVWRGRKNRFPPECCQYCGYNIFNLTSQVCPECSKPIR